MMDYEMARARQEEIRRMVERDRLVMDARRSREPGRPLRLVVGTGLARLGLRLAGPTAVRAALGEAR
jgi:hypothetical protein